MIVSFVQTKGGTGKSTLAMNTMFSQAVAERFATKALVELDPQGTLRTWWQTRQESEPETEGYSFHHISSTQKEVLQDSLKIIAGHNDLLLLDIPGESTGKLHTKFACIVSDLIIIPMRTSTNDEAAFADNLLPIIREITREIPDKKGKFYILPAFTNPKTNPNKVMEYFRDIMPESMQIMSALFPFRGIYENFNREGHSLQDYAASVVKNKRLYQQAEKAIEDIEIICQHLITIMEKHYGSSA